MNEKRADPSGIETAMRERSAVEAPLPGSPEPEVLAEDAWQEIERDWRLYLPMAHETFGALSEDELSATGGNYARLSAFVGERYQLTRAEAEARVRGWRERLRSE